MDLSQWTELNSNIKFIPSKKKFYGSYPYKLTYRLQGSYLISYSPTIYHLSTSVIRRYGSESFDLTQEIKVFHEAYHEPSKDYRSRVEGSSITFFFKTEEGAYSFASEKLALHKSKLISVTRISNEIDRDIIESDKIIVTKDTNFRYRITLRQGGRSTDDREKLANYLKSIREEVKITDNLLDSMLRKYKYISGCYFYVNDLKIVSMISLVAPNTIVKVQEVVPINQ